MTTQNEAVAAQKDEQVCIDFRADHPLQADSLHADSPLLKQLRSQVSEQHLLILTCPQQEDGNDSFKVVLIGEQGTGRSTWQDGLHTGQVCHGQGTRFQTNRIAAEKQVVWRASSGVFLIKDRGSSLLSLKKQGTDEKLLQAIGHVPTGFATQPPLECLQAEVSTVKADAMAAEAAVKNLAKSTRNTLAQQAKAAHTLLAKWRVEWPDGEVPASGTLEAAVLKLMTKKHAEQWLDPKSCKRKRFTGKKWTGNVVPYSAEQHAVLWQGIKPILDTRPSLAGARLARFYSFPVVLLKLDVPKAATTCSTGYSVSKTPIQIWSILCPCGTELACNKPDLLEEMLSTHKGTGCKDARQFFKSEVIHAVTDSMRLIDPRMAQLRKAIPKLLVHVNDEQEHDSGNESDGLTTEEGQTSSSDDDDGPRPRKRQHVPDPSETSNKLPSPAPGNPAGPSGAQGGGEAAAAAATHQSSASQSRRATRTGKGSTPKSPAAQAKQSGNAPGKGAAPQMPSGQCSVSSTQQEEGGNDGVSPLAGAATDDTAAANVQQELPPKVASAGQPSRAERQQDPAASVSAHLQQGDPAPASPVETDFVQHTLPDPLHVQPPATAGMDAHEQHHASVQGPQETPGGAHDWEGKQGRAGLADEPSGPHECSVTAAARDIIKTGIGRLEQYMLEALPKVLSASHTEVTSLKEQLLASQEQVQALERESSRLRANNAELVVQVNNLKAQVEQQQETISGLRTTIKTLAQQLAQEMAGGAVDHTGGPSSGGKTASMSGRAGPTPATPGMQETNNTVS